MSKTELNHAPVPLPAGSVDFQKLRSGLDKAAEASPEKRADAVGKAVNAATADDGMVTSDLSVRVDQKVVEREHPELGVKEQVRVFDKRSDGAKALAEKAERDADMLTRQAEVRAARSGDADTAIVEPPAPTSKTD